MDNVLSLERIKQLLNRFWQHAQIATSRFRIENSLSPILFGSIWFTLPCLLISTLFKDSPKIQTCIITVALSLPVSAFIGFIYFMLRNPTKLQSEEYQIRHEALIMLQQKTGSGLSVSETSLIAIANPSLKELPPPQERVGK